MRFRAVGSLAAIGLVGLVSTSAWAGTTRNVDVLRNPDTGKPVGCRAEVRYADEQDVPFSFAEMQCNDSWAGAKITVQAQFEPGRWMATGRVWTVNSLDARQLIQWGGELCPIEAPCVRERAVFIVRDGLRSNGRIDGRTVIPIDPNVPS